MKINKKILIVEDDSALLDLLGEKFTSEGFDVLKAQHGAIGLEIALREHPDLILLDIVMPVMDGITLSAKIREDSWGRTVPILILTNLSDTETMSKALQNNVFDFLVKSDWKIAEVVARVRSKLSLNL
jgi:DNA-binding response OmpR family regulator